MNIIDTCIIEKYAKLLVKRSGSKSLKSLEKFYTERLEQSVKLTRRRAGVEENNLDTLRNYKEFILNQAYALTNQKKLAYSDRTNLYTTGKGNNLNVEFQIVNNGYELFKDDVPLEIAPKIGGCTLLDYYFTYRVTFEDGEDRLFKSRVLSKTVQGTMYANAYAEALIFRIEKYAGSIEEIFITYRYKAKDKLALIPRTKK